MQQDICLPELLDNSLWETSKYGGNIEVKSKNLYETLKDTIQILDSGV